MQTTFQFYRDDNPGFPGGSKSRLNRAGDAVRKGTQSAADIAIIDDWRAAHRHVLNTFQAILRSRTRNTGIIVAQRHKRRRTIFHKLLRLPGMSLSRMDDIAGCRLIFPSVRDLYGFRRDFHAARFEHEMRNGTDKYDYIKSPKETGYRGVHDVYEYNAKSVGGRRLAGLYVEVQYRTLVQHSWATAVELIGHLTTSQPKFREGDKRYEQTMAWASEILARSFEGKTGPFPEKSDAQVVSSFRRLDKEIGLMAMLRALNSVDESKITSSRQNVILILPPAGTVEARYFRYTPEALAALFELERTRPDCDVVLVRADTGESVRTAYRNYYADARDFVGFVERGLNELESAKRLTQGSRATNLQ